MYDYQRTFATPAEKFIPSRTQVRAHVQVAEECGVSYAPKAPSDQKRSSCAQTESIKGSMYEAKSEVIREHFRVSSEGSLKNAKGALGGTLKIVPQNRRPW